MLLIHILILLFTFLFGYQLYLAIKNELDVNSFCISCPGKSIEGFQSENVVNIPQAQVVNTPQPQVVNTPQPQVVNPYDPNGVNEALILSQKNAGNIELLKERINDLDGVNERLNNIQQSVDVMQSQINGLVEQQSIYANELVGSTPIVVTGLDEPIQNQEEEVTK